MVQGSAVANKYTVQNLQNYKDKSVKIPLEDGGHVVGYLKPISEDDAQDSSTINLLADWRKKHFDAYPTQFPVTLEGTQNFIKGQLGGREDRILFLVVDANDQPIGHLGLNNFNAESQEAEIDSVVRGIEGVMPGAMGLALDTVAKWSFEALKLRKLFLRVFSDNKRAIKLYERKGYKKIKDIPLHKTIEGDVTKFEEIPEGEDLSMDRVFVLMERTLG